MTPTIPKLPAPPRFNNLLNAPQTQEDWASVQRWQVAINNYLRPQQAASAPWFLSPQTSRAAGVVYQNLTGKAVTVRISILGSVDGQLVSDAANPPVTVLAQGGQAGADIGVQLSCEVIPGDYFILNYAGTVVIWLEEL